MKTFLENLRTPMGSSFLTIGLLILDMIVSPFNASLAWVVGILMLVSFFYTYILVMKSKKSVRGKNALNVKVDEGKIALQCIDVEYNADSGMIEDRIRSMKLIPLGNRITKSLRYLYAQYGEIGFETAYVRTDNVAKKEKITQFNGRVYHFRNIKKDVDEVRVYSKTFFKPEENAYRLNYYDLEDVAFNDMFDVYATKGEDVFYMITPPMMEHIKALCKIQGNIAITFLRDRIYIAYNYDVELSGEYDEANDILKVLEGVEEIRLLS